MSKTMTSTAKSTASKPATVAKPPKGSVRADDGTIYKLAPRKALGPVPCSGEVHTNIMIDGGCSSCFKSPYGYGKVESFEYLKVDAVVPGVVVPVNHVGRVYDPKRDAPFEEAVKAGKIKMVGVTEYYKGGSRCHYYGYVVA